MFGTYENFPLNIHKKAYFTFSISARTVQKALIKTMKELNGKTFKLEEFLTPSIPNTISTFEFGIAEEASFNYLDEEETQKALKIIHRKTLPVIDFFCAIRYYKIQKSQKRPLKFDYYMIRFLFRKKTIEVRVFHERGPRHTSPEDLINFVISKINELFGKRRLKPL